MKIKDTFYWFGESYKRPLLGDFLSEGVNLYSSKDFATWTYEGLVFNGTAEMKGMPGNPPYRIERPKVCHNQHTQHAARNLMQHDSLQSIVYVMSLQALLL